MRTHSPFVIDVHELLDTPGSRRSLSLAARVDGLDVGLVRVPEELVLDLVLESIDGGILVQGSVTGAFAGSCRRCLAPIVKPFDIRVAEVYRPAGAAWEEGYVITNGSIDFERMARDTVGVEIPINPLCRPDCAGLCPKCGADLNQGPCRCPADERGDRSERRSSDPLGVRGAPRPRSEVGDPRWAALRELRAENL